MNGDGFRVRTMRPQEVALVLDWAAQEGWNPGLADAACFAAVDPEGFLLGGVCGLEVHDALDSLRDARRA